MNSTIDLDSALPNAPFVEVHRRTIGAPIENVSSRSFSGLIRRSWLAAIERRVQAS